MFNPQRPLTRRQTARVVIAVAILAWATQTLVQQWGFGAIQNETAERFVPRDGIRAARMELRDEATIIGDEVKVRQVARWSDADADLFAPIADLVLMRLGSEAPFRAVSLDELKSTLRDAGVNLAGIHFAGATRCTITRVDVQYDETRALQQWVDAKRGKSQAPQSASAAGTWASTQPADSFAIATDANLATSARVLPAQNAEPAANASLKSILLNDLCTRLKLSPETVQLEFRASDQKTLGLSEPQFRFEIESLRVRNLGEVAWNVTLLSGESRQRVTIGATARAWQNQLVVVKPLAHRQVIQASDVEQQRVLVDRLDDDPVLSAQQAVGQQAARDIKTGTVLTARLIDPVALVRVGQFVTVTLANGNVQVKTVARAMEAGSFGQTIKVKNETTKDTFQVVVTGPQTASVTGH